MSELRPAPEEHLYERIASILDEARSRVARTVNTAMVQAYWLIGREIVEVEQQGAERAGYGEGLMTGVAARLSAKFGKGFSLASLLGPTLGDLSVEILEGHLAWLSLHRATALFEPGRHDLLRQPLGKGL